MIYLASHQVATSQLPYLIISASSVSLILLTLFEIKLKSNSVEIGVFSTKMNLKTNCRLLLVMMSVPPILTQTRACLTFTIKLKNY